MEMARSNICVAFYFSLWDMPDLYTKDIHLDVKPSAPSFPPTLPPPISRVSRWANWNPGHPSREGFLSLGRKSNWNLNCSSLRSQNSSLNTTQTTLFSIKIQTVEVREAQTAKTKDEIQDETEDRRQRDKEKQASPIYPWEHMQRAAREVEEQPHKLLPLHEATNKKNNQSMRVNKPFSYQEIQRIKEGLGDYL